MKNFLKIFLPSFLIFLVSFFYRFNRNNLNHPFWVDEFSSVAQANLLTKYGSNLFTQKEVFVEFHNLTTHFLIGLSLKFFGESEAAARLPFVIIGSLVPVLVYILGRKILNEKVAVVATTLAIFSYWQITWSIQARGYVLQQLLVLISLLLYLNLSKKFSLPKLLLFGTVVLLGLLTHTTYILFIGAFLFHFLIFNHRLILQKGNFFKLSLAIIILLGVAFYTGQFSAILGNLSDLLLNHPNNLGYYHSFLWREQTIIALLAVFGILSLILTQKKYQLLSLLCLPIIFYLGFVCFLFAPYVSRYLLPIFPLLLILAATGLVQIADAIQKQKSFALALLLVAFIVINGDKFVSKPRNFYSLNRDMREIALLDYDAVYGKILAQLPADKSTVAIIDTWPDRSKWYLGENQGQYYIFRWLGQTGTVNGLSKNTIFKTRADGEKYLENSGTPNLKFIGEVSDLELAMSKYQYGFIWIDDASLPEEVIKFVKANLKQEIAVEHSDFDENPYSIWPGALYSWGFEAKNEPAPTSQMLKKTP